MICPHCGRLVEPLTLDAEFHMASRGGVRVALTEREFKLLMTLSEMRRPAYSDWLAEIIDVRRDAGLRKLVFGLRRKIRPLAYLIVNCREGARESAYVLSEAPHEEAA